MNNLVQHVTTYQAEKEKDKYFMLHILCRSNPYHEKLTRRPRLGAELLIVKLYIYM